MYNIGLIVGNVEDPFSNAVSKGAMRASELVGDNLFIFPVKYIDFEDVVNFEPRHQFEYQYNFLFAYAQSHSLDMVIYCMSSITSKADRELSMRLLNTFQGIPMMLVASKEEGYSSIKFENGSGLKDGIRFLIEERGCKHICMLAGREDNEDSIERLNAYKDVLLEKGHKFDEKMVVYGDFSHRCEAEVEKLLLQNSDIDALVCANDTMAITAYKVLKKYQFKIGKDICVMGFDDIGASVFQNPPLATVRADASLLGYQAVIEVHSLLQEYHEKKLDSVPVRDKVVETSFINRESASGLKDKKNIFSEDWQQEYEEKINLMINANHCLNIVTRDMLTFGNGHKGNYLNFLNALRMQGNTCCYLFMLKEPIIFVPRSDFRVVKDLYLQAYKIGNYVIEYSNNEKKLTLNDLFNCDCLEAIPKNYIVIDIFSREKQYGIMVCDMQYRYLSYVENLCYQISMAAKILELLQTQEQLLAEKEIMVKKLEQENLILDNISNKDELTGICNRRGFITKTAEMLKDETNYGQHAAIIYVDLNYLKLINDKYSHAEGNFSLQTCAKALDYFTKENGVVGRIGGDEFAIFTFLPQKGAGEQLKLKLKQYMEEFNQHSEKPYDISMSVGVHEFIISKECELKELIQLADARLYEDKKNKKPFVERLSS